MASAAIVSAVLSLTAQQALADDAISFSREVRPIIADKCFACHGPDEAARKQGMRFDVKEGLFGKTELGAEIVAPGNPEESELYYRIAHPDDDERMPPSDFHLQLSPAEIEIIRPASPLETPSIGTKRVDGQSAPI
jgi:mono/diheme cytochrome c family protein